MTEQDIFDEEDRLESEFLKSKEFSENFRKHVKEETWGKGLPMIGGRNNPLESRYEVVASYPDGRIELLSYTKDNITINVPNDFDKNKIYSGHFKNFYSQIVEGNSEEEVFKKLNDNIARIKQDHFLWVKTIKDDDCF